MTEERINELIALKSRVDEAWETMKRDRSTSGDYLETLGAWQKEINKDFADLCTLALAGAKLRARLSEAHRQIGLAEGKLEASEMAGVVDGWRERAEKAEAELKRLREGKA